MEEKLLKGKWYFDEMGIGKILNTVQYCLYNLRQEEKIIIDGHLIPTT